MNKVALFSIVTPSFNSLAFLKPCCRSVADQQGVAFEHIVVDGASTDGTAEWLRQQAGLKSISEKDDGPHDAENKGFQMARGDIFSYINCDEQYLPNTLAFVKDYFDQHPNVDMLFGDFFSVRPDGSLLAFRKGYPPRWSYIMATHLYVFTCAMFFRRHIFDSGLHFNPAKKFTGDQDFVIRVLRAGYCVRHVNHYMATYVIHPDNMSATQMARDEKRDTLLAGPRWVRAVRYVLNTMRYAEKVLAGAYSQKFPVEYEIYPDDQTATRRRFLVKKASPIWRRE